MADPTPAAQHGLGLDDFLAQYDAGRLRIEDAPTFSLRTDVFAGTHLDPHSVEYRTAVLDLWSRITGRHSYDPEVDEAFPLDFDQYLARPFPYSSGDPVVVGQYLGAVGWFLRTVRPAVGARVVELGAGWGHLSLSLAMLGCAVTAVDLNKASVELLRERAGRWRVDLEVVESEFLTFAAADVDLVVFFEAFHHTADPFALLDRCRAMLRPGGKLVFLADAIYDGFYCPWGIRLDGDAVYMARHAGWLELGFERSFMYRELRRRGLRLGEASAPELGGYGTLVIADVVDFQSSFEGVLSPDEAATWHERVPGLPGRVARERSVVTLYGSDEFDAVDVALVNLTDRSLRAAVENGSHSEAIELERGARANVTLRLEREDRQLCVRSDTGPSTALGRDGVGVHVESISMRIASATQRAE
jgi:SAM-dependent methyltransferase